jgi:type I restriction enzyme S subunit
MKSVKLGDLTSIQTGKIDVNKAVAGGKYPFFTCSRDVYEINDAPFQGKAVLVAGNGDLNVKYYEGKFNAYQRTYFLFVNDENELIPRYLYWFLESYVGQLRTQAIGSTIKYIKMGNLTEAEIPLLSLEAQQEIVEKLDSAFADIDLLEKNLELREENANHLSRSLLSSMFAQSNQLEDSSELPTSRGRAEKLVKLSEIFRVGSSKRVLKADWKESGIPFYRGREITRLSKTGIADNDLFISESHFKELSSNYGVPIVGDIMVTAIGTIGNTYIVRQGDCFYFKDASVLWLHKLSDVNSHFIDYWLKSDLFFEQLDKGNGATVDTLTIEKLSNVKILLPSREKQLEVVEKLDRAFEEIELLKAQIKMEKAFAASLRQSLLSSSFSLQEAVA